MAVAEQRRVEQVLGPDWRTMRPSELVEAVHRFETAAGFGRKLLRYMDEVDAATVGEAFAVLAEREP